MLMRIYMCPNMNVNSGYKIVNKTPLPLMKDGWTWKSRMANGAQVVSRDAAGKLKNITATCKLTIDQKVNGVTSCDNCLPCLLQAEPDFKECD
eukprot:Awhi_evm1s763